MNRIAPLACIALFAAAASAQTAQPPRAPENRAYAAYTSDGGVSQTLQSIYIPPLVNAPFTAIVHTEWTRPMPGGGNFTFVNQRRVARDSTGRIYEERWLLAPKGSEDQSRMNVIQLADPHAHTLYNCYTLQKPRRCVLDAFAEPAVKSFKPVATTSGKLPNNMGTRVHEDLGARSMDGIETLGTRDTSNLNAGVMRQRPAFFHGSASTGRPRRWASTLGLEVVDPSVGKQVFTLTDVNLAEPDPRPLRAARKALKSSIAASPTQSTPSKPDQFQSRSDFDR